MIHCVKRTTDMLAYLLYLHMFAWLQFTEGSMTVRGWEELSWRRISYIVLDPSRCDKNLLDFADASVCVTNWVTDLVEWCRTAPMQHTLQSLTNWGVAFSSHTPLLKVGDLPQSLLVMQFEDTFLDSIHVLLPSISFFRSCCHRFLSSSVFWSAVSILPAPLPHVPASCHFFPVPCFFYLGSSPH